MSVLYSMLLLIHTIYFIVYFFIRVVTGARLVVQDQTIYVQIQQGTVDWVPLTKGFREKIDWEGIKSIDLTSMTLPSDSV